jgi:hypothetical protein
MTPSGDIYCQSRKLHVLQDAATSPKKEMCPEKEKSISNTYSHIKLAEGKKPDELSNK